MNNKKHCFRRFAVLLAALMLFACACTTAPQEDEQPFVFLFMSDTQADPQTGDYSGFGALLEVALSGGPKPSLLVLGGDTVNDDADEDEWRDFRQAADSSLNEMLVAAAAGNHDNSKHIAGRFDWPVTAPETPYQGYFYSFDMNGVHFIIMDSNIMGAAKEEDIAWLEADLKSGAAVGADWRVAVCHHPFWPVAEIPKDINRAQTIRENFLPLLEEYSVDILLVGHQNIYSRCAPEQGPVQVMVASGGKKSYTPVEQSYLVMTADAPNYALVSVTDNELVVNAYDAFGSVIDSFALMRE